MDAQQARQVKQKLEEEISKMLVEFSKNTGLFVDRIYVENMHERLFSGETVGRTYRVEIEAKL